MATYFRSDQWVQDALGNAISGAGVYVTSQPTTQGHTDEDTGRYVAPTPQVQLYADAAGTMPLTQPVQTDGFGHAFFYTAQGTYTVTYYSPQIGQTTLLDQAIIGAAPFTSTGMTPSPDGSTTTFMIPTAPAAFQMIYLNGVLQLPGGVNYTIASNRITFLTPPQVGDQLWAVYQ